MITADLDNIASKLPPWELQVIVHGITYAIRQPTLEEDLRLDSFVKETKTAEVIAFFWALFDGPQPPTSAMTRDTLMMLYTQLLLYRKARNTLYASAIQACASVLESVLTARPMVRSAMKIASSKPN